MYSVLYVDDDKHLLDVARFFLEETGEVSVDTASLATDALALPGFSSYDAIIADYEMPRMDGIAFLKKVRADYGNIPFILFTGKGREAIVIEAINNGADFYLQKGGEPESQFAELFHMIRKAVDKRRMEEEIAFKNAILSTQQDTSMDAILIVDANKKILNYTSNFIGLFGIPDELVASSLDEPVLRFVSDQIADPDVFLARVKDLYTHKNEKCIEDILLKNGQIIEWVSFPMLGDKDRYYGRVWYFRDITERKRVEDALRESEETFRTFVEKSSDGILLVDESGMVMEWNPALETITGITREGAIGKPYIGIIDRMMVAEHRTADILDRMKRELETASLTGSSVFFGRQIEACISRPDGTRRRVQQTVFPIRICRGFRLGSITRDITDLR
jgi:PAS domain S-box-containing protein